MPPKHESVDRPYQSISVVGGSGSRTGGGGSSNTGHATTPRSGSARIRARASTSAWDSESVPAPTPVPSAYQTPPFLLHLPPNLLLPISRTTNPSTAHAPDEAEGLIWLSDTTFNFRPPHQRTGGRYTFITLSLDQSPATVVKVTRLLSIYSDRWEHYCRMHTAQHRSAPDHSITSDAAGRKCQNVMQHLQVLWELRGNRERWLRKLASILEPKVQRTFLFRLVKTREVEEGEGIWVEVDREGRSEAGMGRGRSKAVQDWERETGRVWELLRRRGLVV